MIKNLSSLLERFSKKLNKSTDTKNIIINTIKNKTEIELTPEQINLKDGVLEFSASPIIHNEIRLKEEMILTELKKFHKLPASRILYR